MELIAYQIVYAMGIIIIFLPNKIIKNYAFIIFLLIGCILSFSIRENSINENNLSDMSNYIRYMTGEDQGEFYLIREFIFWWSLKFLYIIFDNAKYVLVFIDLICFLLLFYSIENIKNSFSRFFRFKEFNYHFMAYGFLIFFPTVMGMHTGYRQFIASIFLIYSYSLLITRKNSLSLIFLFLSVFTHNISLLFVPVIYMAKLYNPKYKIGFLTGMVLICIMYLIKDGQGILYRSYFDDVGAFNVFIYYFIGLILILIYSAKLKFLQLFSVTLLFTLYYLSSYNIFGSSAAQRIILFSFSFLYLIIFIVISGFNKSKFLNLILFHVTILPLVLIFNSSIKI